MLHLKPEYAIRRSRNGHRLRWSLFRCGLSLEGFLRPVRSLNIAAVISVMVCLKGASPVCAEERLPTLAPPQNAVSYRITPDQAKASVQWLSNLAVTRMPQHYEGDKDWGKQKKVWSGVKIRMDKGKLRTNRRHRQVNHGRWIQYSVKFPKYQSISSTIDEVEPIPTSSSLPNGGLRIRSTTLAPMQFTARIQRWSLGIRLYSVTVDGQMEVELKAKSTVTIIPDYSEVPPAIVIDPHIETASLRLMRFEVDRVSHIGGDVAEAWGEILQEVIVKRVVTKNGDRLTEKLNRSIEKHRRDLRLSIVDWITHR